LLAERPISVLVTAVGGYGFQILNALRLAPDRSRIVGADMSPICAQFALCDEGVTVPAANAADYIDALQRIVRHYDIRAIFPGSEQELKVLSKKGAPFRDAGILLPICPPDVLDICMDKEKTVAWLEKHGFSAPAFRMLHGESDIGEIDFYPVVVKPVVGGSGSRNTFIAQSAEELRHLSRYLAAAGDSFVVQEYVGTPDAEFTVGVLHDLDGNYIDAIAIRRHLSGALHVRASVPNQTGRAELGRNLVISSGVSHGDIGRFPDVTESCRKIASALGAKGPINIQCRLFKGAVYPFEINPRFSGTTGLRALVGYNEPQQLIDIHLKGRAPSPSSYRSATIVRSLKEQILDGSRAKSWSELM